MTAANDTTTRQDIAEYLRDAVSKRSIPTWSSLQEAYEEIERLRANGTVPSEDELARIIREVEAGGRYIHGMMPEAAAAAILKRLTSGEPKAD